jgi:hypothetical protein
MSTKSDRLLEVELAHLERHGLDCIETATTIREAMRRLSHIEDRAKEMLSAGAAVDDVLGMIVAESIAAANVVRGRMCPFDQPIVRGETH